MKSVILFFAGFLFILNLNSSNSQTYFQKITNGSIVNTITRGNISAWGDYDNDGFQDVVISYVDDNCNGCTYNLHLYKNIGNGHFERVFDNAIAQTSVAGSGVAWADYDNDGYLDLFVCGTIDSKNKLLHNEQNGNFSNVTSGILVNDVLSWSQACAWADYNKDGWIDLFVANRGNERNFLYKNTGNGNFVKVTTGNIVNDVGASRSCAWGDYNNDGWPDLFVLNYQGENDYFYYNNGDETFTKITDLPMVNDGRWGNSCGWIDYDNDGNLDLFVTNNSANNSLFHNNGQGDFILDNSPLTFEGNSHGFTFGDYDNDGYDDFFICNKNRSNSLFKNNGGSSFTNITNEIVSQEGGSSSISASMVDHDNDGKLDLFVANRFSIVYNYLYKNTGPYNNNYITLKLKGCISNSFGIGARIKIIAGGNQQIKEVTSGTGWASQCSLWPHFGLGTAERIDSLIVYWPSDSITRLADVNVNQILNINECSPNVIGINNNTSKNLSYRLEQNYPNPFNPSTAIRYTIMDNAFTSLKIYDMLGNEVAVLVNQNMPAGSYEIEWNAEGLASGIYYYKLQSGNFISTLRMTLLK